MVIGTSIRELVGQVQGLLRQGRAGEALELLRAAQAGSKDPEIPLNIALVLRLSGDLRGALAALEQTLALDPYHFMALLSKGGILEMMGQEKAAALIYRNALQLAPPSKSLPPHVAGAVERARAAVARHHEALAQRLKAATAALRASFADEDLGRFDECLDILAGLKKPYVQEPLLLTFPRLPPIPFYPREYFPWLERLEAATAMIRDEAVIALNEDRQRFRPYIQIPVGLPVNQWAELNNSRDWSTLHFWRDGERVAETCLRFPKTTALLESLPLAHQAGYGPTAMFSILAPRTRIPPHTGSSNTRLIGHLPLVLPDSCAFRVGNVTRPWRMGEAFIFDDTIEHEAWNGSDEARLILIFDVWNPLLTEAERKLVEAMMVAYKEFSTEIGPKPSATKPQS